MVKHTQATADEFFWVCLAICTKLNKLNQISLWFYMKRCVILAQKIATSLHSHTFPTLPTHHSPTFPSSPPSQQLVDTANIAMLFYQVDRANMCD